MLSENIQRLIKLRNLTSKQLAEMVGVSPTHISYIVNNKRYPSFELLRKIMIALETNETELFKGENTTNNNTIINNYYTEQEKKNRLILLLLI